MNTLLKPCPACGEGHLHQKTEANTYTYKDTEYPVTLYFSECDYCGSDLSDAQDVLQGKRQVMAIRKQADGLLTGVEVLAIRKSLGFTQAQAATVFGGGAVAFSKYENDDVAQSEAMNKLIRLAAEVPAARSWLVAQVGIAVTKVVPQSSHQEFEFSNSFINGTQAWEAQMYCLARKELPESNPISFTIPANDQAYQEAVYG